MKTAFSQKMMAIVSEMLEFAAELAVAEESMSATDRGFLVGALAVTVPTRIFGALTSAAGTALTDFGEGLEESFRMTLEMAHSVVMHHVRNPPESEEREESTSH